MRIRRISYAFERFSDFKDPETDFAFLSNPFFVFVEVPQKYQMELIELQRNSILIAKSENVDIKTFYQYVVPK